MSFSSSMAKPTLPCQSLIMGDGTRVRVTIIHFVVKRVYLDVRPKNLISINVDRFSYFFFKGPNFASIYRVSHELRSLLRESVPYVKLYRYNPKHLFPKFNGYEDIGQRSLQL